MTAKLTPFYRLRFESVSKKKAGITPGLYFFLLVVDGRVKPGHDDVGRPQFEARFGGDAGHDLISVS